jgi:hypothetical protein
MKTYMRFILAATLVFAVGFIAAGTVTAAEQPIWHNFTNSMTLSGTLPSEAHFTNTNPIWQAQIETYQRAESPQKADQQMSPAAMAQNAPFSRPIWCELTKCL